LLEEDLAGLDSMVQAAVAEVVILKVQLTLAVKY
jgi:hypothetical protein